MTNFKDLKYILLYGFTLAFLVFLLKWLQWRFVILDNSVDIYVGLIAIIFTGLGIWVSTQMTKMKVEKIIVEKEVLVPVTEDFKINEIELKKLNLTNREHEILKLITNGKSNAEIADKLFLSVSTVKTHVSNLYSKMNVKSRAQAVAKAKKLKITD